MRRALLPTICAVTALAVIAAPALSLERWRPQPVDFELAAPAAALRSPPLRAPKRFNLVGLRWRGGGAPRVSLRARRDGGDWTRWTEVTADAEHAPDPRSGEPQPVGGSAPLWVGEGDWVQYRLSRPVRHPQLHFVNVQGTATAADRLRTAVRGAVNGGLVSLAGTLSAHAAEDQPAVVNREEWGADACPPRRAPELGEVKAAFVHHTVTANDYTADEAPQIVLGICRFHRNSNGWNDIGYNFLVDKYGTIYEGRAGGIDQAVIGAQAQGYNAQSTGIANLGTHTSVAQTPEALDAMARLIRWKLPLHGNSTSGSVVLTSSGGPSNRYPVGSRVRVRKVAGHRDTGATECPGGELYDQLPRLRRMVGRVPAAEATSTTIGLTPSRVAYGSETVVSGRVLDPAGEPLAGAPVEVQKLRAGRWVTTAEATTDTAGAFAVSLRPRSSGLVRARYPGDDVLPPSNSVQRLLGVRPVIFVPQPPHRGRVGRALAIDGLVAPRKRSLSLVVQRRRGGRWSRAGVDVVRTRSGGFATSFVPGERGRWGFYLVARGDSRTLRAASERYEVLVGR